jgi:hypothetical protein
MRLSQIAISSGIEPTPCGFVQQRTLTGARSGCKNTSTVRDDDRWIRSPVLLSWILRPTERRLIFIAGRLWTIYGLFPRWFCFYHHAHPHHASQRFILSRWFLHSLLSHSPSAWLTVLCCPALPRADLLLQKVDLLLLLLKAQLLLLLQVLKVLLHRHLDLTIRSRAAQSWL